MLSLSCRQKTCKRMHKVHTNVLYNRVMHSCKTDLTLFCWPLLWKRMDLVTQAHTSTSLSYGCWVGSRQRAYPHLSVLKSSTFKCFPSFLFAPELSLWKLLFGAQSSQLSIWVFKGLPFVPIKLEGEGFHRESSRVKQVGVIWKMEF